MTQLGGDISPELKTIRKTIKRELKKRKINEIDALMNVTGKDFLLKIWRQILSVPMGIAILTDGMKKNTIANIFYEIGLLDSLGKEMIVVKSKNFTIPSDFIRTEYITHNKEFKNNFKKYIDNIFERADYYEVMADLVEANPVLSIDYLRRSYLITGNKALIAKAKDIYENNTFDDQSKFMISNFLKH